jgi:membrane protease YdiL (CAAX protease family)
LALLAGTLGLVALLLFQRVLNRLVALPQQQEDLSQVPPTTAVLLVLMGSLVAGVVEEASFRGYMQRPIERRHGSVIAILVTGALFGLVHFIHPEVALVLMPFYMGAAAVYGTLAYLTDSIFPGMVLHAAGNVFVVFDLLARGQSEWQASPIPEPLIWQTGPDVSFVISVALFLLVGTAAVWAYVGLASARSRS